VDLNDGSIDKRVFEVDEVGVHPVFGLGFMRPFGWKIFKIGNAAEETPRRLASSLICFVLRVREADR
jgi:hypothetical protein